MLRTISGTYDLIPNSSWNDLQTEEIRLVCDTTSAPVVVNLPVINTIKGGTLNVKIYVVDGAGNAGANNITINTGGSNKIGASTSYVINVNNGGAYIQIGSPTNWLLTTNNAIGGGGGGDQLPNGLMFSAKYDIATAPITLDFSSGTDKIIQMKANDIRGNVVSMVLPTSNNLCSSIQISDAPAPNLVFDLDLANFSNITELTLNNWASPNATVSNLASATKLTDISIYGVSAFATSLPNLSGLTNLKFLAITNNSNWEGVASLINNILLEYVFFRNSNLSGATISQNLIDLDTNGVLNGQYEADGGTNAPVGDLTVAGAAAKTSLEGKGWYVGLNP